MSQRQQRGETRVDVTFQMRRSAPVDARACSIHDGCNEAQGSGPRGGVVKSGRGRGLYGQYVGPNG